MSSDEEDFGFEETKSTILDYFVMFQRAKWAVITTIASSLLILGLTFGLFSTVFEIHGLLEPKIFTMIIFFIVIIFSLAIWLPISNGGLLLKVIFSGKRLQRELVGIQNILIRKSYLINFELVEPSIVITQGEPNLEKIMNHLSLVFPDVLRINNKRIKKRETAEKFASKFKRKLHFLRNYDLGIKTILGWYVIQFYDSNLSNENIQEVIKKFSLEKSLFGANIQRLILICKNPSSSFNEQDVIDFMQNLESKIKIDIITQNEYGYSTVWVN